MAAVPAVFGGMARKSGTRAGIGNVEVTSGDILSDITWRTYSMQAIAIRRIYLSI
jgi:hypothetical protein